MTLGEVPVALLAGGLATRLRPVTATIPKALVEVAGRPFIDHQLELLGRNGVRRVVACVGHLGEQVETHLKNNGGHSIETCCLHDGPRLLGTGGAVRRALPLLGDVFWVLYGDSYLDFDYGAALADFERSGKLGMMTVLRNDDHWDRSNAVFRDGRLLFYSKTERRPDMNHIDYGACLLRRAAVERLNIDEPSDLADLYGAMVRNDEMAGHEVSHRFYEIGSPRGLAETETYLQSRAA